jgi:hypothetical protein
MQRERDSIEVSRKAADGVYRVTEAKGLVDAALEISMRRKAVLGLMRKALESGDEEQALKFARQLCGLEHGRETGHRTDSSIN